MALCAGAARRSSAAQLAWTTVTAARTEENGALRLRLGLSIPARNRVRGRGRRAGGRLSPRAPVLDCACCRFSTRRCSFMGTPSLAWRRVTRTRPWSLITEPFSREPIYSERQRCKHRPSSASLQVGREPARSSWNPRAERCASARATRSARMIRLLVALHRTRQPAAYPTYGRRRAGRVLTRLRQLPRLPLNRPHLPWD